MSARRGRSGRRADALHSWSNGQTLVLPDGEFHSANGVRTQEALATGYFTYEPSFAVSYLKNGPDLTIDDVYDINATNRVTHYSSGQFYYLDFTAAQTFGRF